MLKIGIDGHNLEQPKAGVARTLMEELRGLSQIPFVRENIKFILYFKFKASKDPLFDELASPELQRGEPLFERKVLPHIIRPSSAIFYNILLPYFASKDKVDLCYFPCYMLPLFYKGRSVVTIHDCVYEVHPEWFPPYYRYSYHILSSRAIKKASAILTISEFSKQEIMKYYNVPAEKIWVAPLAPASFFRKIEDEEKLLSAKKKYGVEKDFVFFVGQIFTRRHVYEAMLAFEKIVEDFPNFQFLVIGRDLTYPALGINNLAEMINKRLGREAIVRKNHVESDEDLVLLYNAAELFIYLSEYEGFGLPPIESLACNTPPLLACSGVNNEVFDQAAFYVENPTDTDEISCKMRLALLNKEQKEAVLRAGKELVKKFNWENHCKKLLKLFQTVLINGRNA